MSFVISLKCLDMTTNIIITTKRNSKIACANTKTSMNLLWISLKNSSNEFQMQKTEHINHEVR